MARNQPPFTWAHGFKERVAPDALPAWADERYYTDSEDGAKAHYVLPDQTLRFTTKTGTAMGVEELPGWPALYDGTMGVGQEEHNGVLDEESNEMHNGDSNRPMNELLDDPKHQADSPLQEVDVLICGGKHMDHDTHLPKKYACSRTIAGPFGLEVAICLARMGLTFRIIGARLSQFVNACTKQSRQSRSAHPHRSRRCPAAPRPRAPSRLGPLIRVHRRRPHQQLHRPLPQWREALPRLEFAVRLALPRLSHHHAGPG